MKKIIVFSSLAIGTILLSGCSQQLLTGATTDKEKTGVKIVLPIDSKEEACLTWDNLKISYGSYGLQSCSDAQDKGDYWAISASGGGCTGCNGEINKQDGSFIDKQCFIANTCDE